MFNHHRVYEGLYDTLSLLSSLFFLKIFELNMINIAPPPPLPPKKNLTRSIN